MTSQFVWFDYVVKNGSQLEQVKDLSLIKGYHQIFEIHPGLHPDGFDDPDSGWPDELRPVCAEMWRRVDLKDSTICEEHMYYINKAFRQLVKDSRANDRHCR